MRSRGRRIRGAVDFWPGFVDALSTMLIVIMFLVLVFVLAQFFLVQAISGKNAALEQLQGQLNQLTEMLSLEKTSAAELRAAVEAKTAEIAAARAQAANLEAKLAAQAERTAQAQKEVAQRDIRLSELLALGEIAQGDLKKERDLSSQAQRQVELLNAQISELRSQLARIQAALDLSETKAKEQGVTIADLGTRLNLALASKVEELSRYRSEFFGRLRALLGARQDIQIVGDRFVFQSEVLFAPGSADLGAAGKTQLTALASTLKELSPRIPKDIHWVLQVEGHTDRVPIRTALFPSNWELSTARAIAVVKFLSAAGIAPDHLSATGFGEFQPLVPGDDDASRKKNRRIELKLTQR